ncbi:hypothetical protein CLAIMM_06412 [Cladophialophora immunda]|nr:hypothetical protein CLAIMM_06412 [Cladophialophora immunda]
MPRKDIHFQTDDGVTLRGWLFTPENHSGKLACLIMAHGWSAVKEMELELFANHFTSHLALACLVFDHRSFGASDGEPRYEIVPSLQKNDYSDAVTYAQSLDEIDADKVGIWGTSYSGGVVLEVAAVDKRVKAVLAQIPFTTGPETYRRLMSSDSLPEWAKMFQNERLSRMAGKEPTYIPIAAKDPLAMVALPKWDCYHFMIELGQVPPEWVNQVTVKSVELMSVNDPTAQIHRISPTPLLMTVAENDTLTPTDLALEAYSRAREPKELHLIPGGHFDGYGGPNFERNVGTQTEFLAKWLCKRAIPM